ncbi:MAG: PH domain-containing protein [Phycisphaerales bacterium]|nr:MAG: PH domain-containing protein [Phycisphaerales bacterium]
MLAVRCDNCDVLFEVEGDKAGQKVSCPECGDVTFAPLSGRPDTPKAHSAGSKSRHRGSDNETRESVDERASAEDRAVKAGLPPARGPEVEVCVIRPSIIRSKPGTFAALCATLVIGLIGGVMALSAGLIPLGAIAITLAGLAGAWMAVWRFSIIGSYLQITTKRTVEHVGIFSKRTTEVLHRDIRNFRTSQTFWQRVFGVGTVEIDSAADANTEIVMENVPNPRRIHQMIDVYRPL